MSDHLFGDGQIMSLMKCDRTASENRYKLL